VANGGGARPESVRESGLPVAGGSGPGAESSGEAQALERRGRRGVETGGRVEQRERLGNSTAEGGKRRGKVGVRAWGCHVARGCRGAWPRPADGARQRPERGAHGRRAGRTERGIERANGWAAAQCRVAVPLTGGAGLSVGAGRARARVRSCADACGLAREETETGRPDAQ
jgi:hypothetical protein